MCVSLHDGVRRHSSCIFWTLRSGETEKALALLSTMRPARRQHPVSGFSDSPARRSLSPPSASHKPRRAPLSGPHATAGGGPPSSGRQRIRSDGSGGAGAVTAEARGGRDSGRERGEGGRGGRGPKADVFTWSAAMTACIEGGQWQRVEAMLEVGGPSFFSGFDGAGGGEGRKSGLWSSASCRCALRSVVAANVTVWR